MFVLSKAIGICDTDIGINLEFVDVKPAAVFVEKFEHKIPPIEIVAGLAGTGHQAKRVNFGRDKFTGYRNAPFIDALTDDRPI